MQTPLALRMLAVVFLVGANAFFVAAEFVLVSVRPTRLRQLDQEGHTAARIALRLHNRMDRVLPATQLGVTLASLALGWIGEDSVAELLQPVFATLGPAPSLGAVHSIAIAIAFLGITGMHVVFGEVVPKNVALGQGSERLALLVSPPLEIFMQVTRPLLWLLNVTASAVSRLFGAQSLVHRHAHSPEEMKMLVTAGIESGLLPEHIEGIMHSVLDLDTILVREIMVPRPDIIAVPIDTSLEKVLQIMVERKVTRMPVWERSPESFIGSVRAQDLYRAWYERLAGGSPQRPFKLRSVLRPLLIIPETKPLDQLLNEFKEHRRHLALVVDEFGSIAGLVTVTDVIERILGDFTERPEREEFPVATAAGMVLDGSTHVHEIADQYDIALPRDAGFETLAGFVMSRLGRIPHVGDSLGYHGWRFTVEQMEGHRVAAVRLDPLPAASAPNPAEKSA